MRKKSHTSKMHDIRKQASRVRHAIQASVAYADSQVWTEAWKYAELAQHESFALKDLIVDMSKDG